MAITYFLGPQFKWYFNDAEGRPAADGTMETFDSSDHVTPKPIYSSPAGPGTEWPNPMILDGSGGTKVPMYWEDDGVGGKYYVVVKDASGRLITTIDNYPILPSAGGGGPAIDFVFDVKNEIVNGNFHFVNNQVFGGVPNLGESVLNPINPVAEGFTAIAPGGGSIKSLRTSGHYTDGSIIDSSNKITSADVRTGWLFFKNTGGGLDDTISFDVPAPGVGHPSDPGDNAPRYFEYSSVNALASTDLDLTYIVGDVRAYSGQTVEVSFDAFGSVASVPTSFVVDQNFGSGGTPSSIVLTPTAFTFPTGIWSRLNFTVNIPSIVGKTIGDDLNDTLRFRWKIPGNNTTTFKLTNLQVVLQEPAAPKKIDFIYENYNVTAAKVLAELIHGHLPKTGDTKFSIDANPTQGWIVISDVGTTLGNDASGATWKGEALRNLFNLVWNSYSDANATVVPGPRGASADADFDANKTIFFPAYVDRVVAGVNTSRVNIQTKEGAFTHILTVPEIPPHAHNYSGTLITSPVPPPFEFVFGAVPSAANRKIDPIGALFTTFNAGGGAAHNITQPTSYMYLHVKL